MQILAAHVRERFPDARIHTIENAAFTKLLPLPDCGGGATIEAFCDISETGTGAIAASLVTRTPSRSGTMTRTLVHASLVFSQDASSNSPEVVPDAPEPPCFDVDPDPIYRELVPFGPTFRNITGPLHVYQDGAVGVVRSGPGGESPDGSGLLGSSFPLDAAFHAACVWGQRHAGVVAFPVGFERRTIVNATRPGEIYPIRVRPVKAEAGTLYFDLWILDRDSRTRESVRGLMMKGVTGGQVVPPDWIRVGTKD
jgi:hypothetical protein